MNKTLPEETASPPEVGETERPLGWAGTLLSEICEINPAKPSSDDLKPDELVTFVPMPAVDADAGAITNPQVRRFADVRKGFTAFRNGDVIMAKITPCMENGKAAIASGLTNGLGFGSTEFHVLRSTGAALPEFVYYFIRQESFRRAAESEMTGSVGQKRVPAEFLRFAEIPLPPLAEQKRIVAKLRELLAGVNAARERLARVPAILKRFRQAVLASAYDGRLTEEWRTQSNLATECTWPISRIADVCSVIVDCPHSTPTWVDHGEVCLRTTNFTKAGLDLAERRYVAASTYRQRVARLEPRSGDVVYSREGGILGIACVIPPGLRACLGQRMMLMRPNAKCVVPDFLCNALNSPAVVDVVTELTGGSASPHLNVGDIRRFAVPLPSLVEQQEIVRRVEALFSLADTIEKRVTAATAQAEKLTHAILAKAFSGELVPTEAELARREGRGYEPAAELLARVNTGLPAKKAIPPSRKASRMSRRKAARDRA